MAFKLQAAIATAIALGTGLVSAGSLKDIEHVVIFMQENRSWDTVRLSALWNIDTVLTKSVFRYYAWSSGIQ